ncbi:MAG: HdeD family acid-resistance protein [Nocardioidaceae bacterium]
MTAVTHGPGPATKPISGWWIFLVTGIAWVLISLVVLGFDPDSAQAIGWLTGIVIIAAGANELLTMFLVQGWRWLHLLLGVLFIVVGIGALLDPFQTFGILALLIGWYLVFKGIFGIVFSLALRHEVQLWGLLLAAGILELIIGVWAIGYPGRSAALLILWVGVGAMMRGITEILLAFQVRQIRELTWEAQS